MMQHRTINPRSLESLLAVLETLRHTPQGPALLQQIDAGSHVRDDLQALIQSAFLEFLQNAVTRYEKRTHTDPTTRIKAKLIARSVAALAIDASNATCTTPLDDAAALRQHLVATLWAAGEERVRQAPSQERTAPEPAATNTTDMLRPLVQTLAAQIEEATMYSADGLARLKMVEASLERAQQMHELDELRDILRLTVEELLADNRTLDDRLRQARYNAKQLAFKTALPGPAATSDRGALLQRMEAETRRAERHRHPLSLALLGPGGTDRSRPDETIHRYLESVSACARAYDVVAPNRPYGVVWLLPATDTAQSMQALRKVQHHLVRQHGDPQRLASFTGAVVRYGKGETPAALLARAENLILHAKNAGPGHIECET